LLGPDYSDIYLAKVSFIGARGCEVVDVDLQINEFHKFGIDLKLWVAFWTFQKGPSQKN
jgi:hypothetical protein